MLACNRLQTESREPHAAVQDARGALSGGRAVAALAALAAAAACFLTAESLPVGLLPQVATSMHTSLSATGLLVTIYALVVVATTVPLSHLTRHLPRRLVLACSAAALLLGCLGCVLASSYAMLLVFRVLTAAAQAIFWAVGPVEATNLVRPQLRARAVTAVFGGSAVGLVLGLPACTWIGHAAGWRVAFGALAAAAMVLFALIVLALPGRAPTAAVSGQPHMSGHRRYWIVVATTCLAVTGYFAAYTYASPFLVRVSGLPRGSVALVLLGVGLTSTVGLATGGALYSRRPRSAIGIAVGMMALALLGLFAFGTVAPLAPLFLAVNGLGQSLLTVGGQTAVLELGPPNGTAWFSTAYNVGIASGPLLGALALEGVSLRATALAGALAVACALALTTVSTLRRG